LSSPNFHRCLLHEKELRGDQATTKFTC